MNKELAVLEYLLDTMIHCQKNNFSHLPSEPKLEKSLKVSRTTIRKALQRLENCGLIERKVGHGTLLRRPVEQWECNKILRSATEEIEQSHIFPNIDNVILTQRIYKIGFFYCEEVGINITDKNLEGIRFAAAPRNHRIFPNVFKRLAVQLSGKERIEGDFDGIIINANIGEDELALLEKIKCPWVLINYLYQINNGIIMNVHLGCQHALQQFIHAGHRNIAVIDQLRDDLLTRGLVESVKKSDPRYHKVVYRRILKDFNKFIKNNPQITAIYLSEDHDLEKLLSALEKNNRSVGKNIEIIILTNRDIPPFIPPNIGQICIDQHGIGVWALKLIEQMLDIGARRFPPLNLSGLYIPPEMDN